MAGLVGRLALPDPQGRWNLVVPVRVLADGVFDPMHYGHIRYLQAARKLGAPLIVNIAPDSAIIAKGRLPFQTQSERASMVGALRCVDAIRLYPSLEAALYGEHPVYLVKGNDWRDRLPDVVLKAAHDVGAVIVFTDTQERSSTERLSA